MKRSIVSLLLLLASVVSAQSVFRSKSDVLVYLNAQSPFRNAVKGVSLGFPEAGARMSINSAVRFFNPDVIIESNVKAIVQYQSLTNASSLVAIVVDAEHNTITDRSDNTVYNAGAEHQDDSEMRDDGDVYSIVEESASPKGGMAAFYKFVGSKLKYPAAAVRMGAEGKVFVEFIINKDGTLSDAQVVSGIGAGCDEEAMRVILASPPWNPGTQSGKPVRQKYTLPIQFKLQ